MFTLSYFSHMYILFFCLFIFIFLSSLFYFLFFHFNFFNVSFTHSLVIEYFWTLLPISIVLFLSLPLYFYSSSIVNTSSLLFFVANQWFWDVDQLALCSAFSTFSYDFFFLNSNLYYIPFDYSSFLFYLTSNDVLHAFSIPSLSLLIDLVPGCLHSLSCTFPCIGLYLLCCNQICGLNHSLMSFHFYLS